MATRGNGEFLPLPNLGRVVPGAPADLLIFREDPTRDLAALDTLEAVVAQGRLYPRSALDEQLARYQKYLRGRVFDAVSVWIARRVLARVAEQQGDPS